MKKLRKPLLFTLALLPVAAVAAYVTVLYQMELYDPAAMEVLISQVGSEALVVAISVVQVMVYGAICGFFGYVLSEKLGLMRPFRFARSAVLRTLLLSVGAGILFSLDYWTFGAWIPGIREGIEAGMTVSGWAASVLYGGILEEVMLRLFVMSLIAWLLWKLFFRKREAVPTGVVAAANILAALLFAAGHLPATMILFGALTPMLLFRCFLLNGGFGLLFGWLYRKYGIQYAILAHAGVHVVSKLIWLLFI